MFYESRLFPRKSMLSFDKDLMEKMQVALGICLGACPSQKWWRSVSGWRGRVPHPSVGWAWLQLFFCSSKEILVCLKTSEEAVGQIDPKKSLPQDEIMVNLHMFLVSMFLVRTGFVLPKFQIRDFGFHWKSTGYQGYWTAHDQLGAPGPVWRY